MIQKSPYYDALCHSRPTENGHVGSDRAMRHGQSSRSAAREIYRRPGRFVLRSWAALLCPCQRQRPALRQRRADQIAASE